MPVKRATDGNIIEEKTKMGVGSQPSLRTLPGQAPADAAVAPPEESRADAGRQQSGYEAQTVLAKPASAAARDDASDRDGKTRIYRPGRTEEIRPAAAMSGTADTQSAGSAMDDPPAGWLVVVRGPGQGNFLTIGNGSNSIGRDPEERVCVDFGDEMISRRGHSTITYDPRGKAFYIQHGAGKNLTYLEGKPVLSPTELAGFSRVTLGNTVLLFVPLCCERFDWEDYTQ